MTDQGEKAGRREASTFTIVWQGAEVTISLLSAASSDPDPPRLAAHMAAINPGWSFLSPLSARVLFLLASPGAEWLKGEEIARRLTESEHGKLKHVLTDMAERNLLESGPAGYRLAVPSGVSREDYRVALLEYLATNCPGASSSAG